MTKYKWSLLGLIVSIILFLIFMINPLIEFSNAPKFKPTEPIPEEIVKLKKLSLKELGDPLAKYLEADNPFSNYANGSPEYVKQYSEWYRNVPKKFVWSSLNVFWKSFYHWNLFWILIIIFSFMTLNYKKSK